MKSVRYLLVLGIVLPVVAASGEADNGWTASASQTFLNGCIDSSTRKQMQYMFDSGQIRKDATEAEQTAAKSRVADYVLKTCTCTRMRIQKEVAFKDVGKLKDNPAYTQTIMTQCANAALQRGK